MSTHDKFYIVLNEVNGKDQYMLVTPFHTSIVKDTHNEIQAEVDRLGVRQNLRHGVWNSKILRFQ